MTSPARNSRPPSTRRPRITTRGLMIAVAVVAVGLWGARMCQLRWIYRERAAEHAWNESGSRGYASDHEGAPSDSARQAVERGRTLETYHARLRRKYERAAA